MSFFFWFALIIFIGWVLFIYILPLVMRYYLKKLSGKMKQQAEDMPKQKEKEGTISVDYIPENHKEKEAPGDYVNYEEINEK